MTNKDIYACDGVTFEFAITFPVDRVADVYAFVTLDSDGTVRELIPNQDYVIDTSTWTLVTRVDDNSDPLPAGYTLTITRQTTIVQPSGRSSMSAHVFRTRTETLTRIFQELREQLDRTLHIGQDYPPYFRTTAVYAIPAPILTSLDPASVYAESAEFELTLTGTNFEFGAVVRVDGADRDTVWDSHTQLRATILDTDIASAGSLSITVLNPISTLVSNALALTVAEPGTLVMVANVGAGDRTAWSGDGGLTWTTVAAAIASRAWTSLAFAPTLGAKGTLVAGSTDASTTNLMYSLDRGKTWIASNAKSGADGISGITWMPSLGLLVAGLSSPHSKVYTSGDGITWSDVTFTGTYAGRPATNMSSASGVLHCTDGSSSGYSTNGGITFTISLVQGARRAEQSLAYSPALALAVAAGTPNGNYWTSSNMQTWTNTGVATGAGSSNNPVAWSPTLALFASVYGGAGGISPIFKSSTNGAAWNTETVADHTAAAGLCWSQQFEKFVSCGFSSSTGRVAYSTDGHAWSQVTAPNNSQWRAMVECL